MTRIVLACAISAAAMFGAPPSDAATVACSLWAHVTDKDPKGTNVRARPTSKSAVVARLKARKAGRNPPLPLVRITGQQGDWFRISKAELAGKAQFQGTGWVHGSLLAVQVRGGVHMYARASKSAKRVQSTGDVEAEGRLLACRRGWVRIRHSETKKRGWLSPDDHCPGWQTTCS